MGGGLKSEEEISKIATETAIERNRGLIPESAGSYVKRPSLLFWPPVFTREKDMCPSEG